jgi:hypothetical protein
MQLADLTIDSLQQQTEQLIRTYSSNFNLDGAFVNATDLFEHESLVLLEDGWRLKQVTHQGSLVSPQTVVAVYAKE